MTRRDLDTLRPLLIEATGAMWRAGWYGYMARRLCLASYRVLLDTWTERAGNHPGMLRRRLVLRRPGQPDVIVDVAPGRGWAGRVAEAVARERAA